MYNHCISGNAQDFGDLTIDRLDLLAQFQTLTVV